MKKKRKTWTRTSHSQINKKRIGEGFKANQGRMAQAVLRIRQVMMTMISTENFHQESDKRGQGAPSETLFL